MNMTLYDRIRQLRIDAGMSQDDLAHALGYKDRSMITKIEAGKVDISQKKILAFARALDTTPGYLMGWTEESADYSPVTPEAKILARDTDKLPPEEREQLLSLAHALYSKYEHYFEKEGDNGT